VDTPSAQPSEREKREREWLVEEVARAASLTAADRVRILCDLFDVVEAIQRTKSKEQLAREEKVRCILDGEGLERYRALAERLERA
jgi:hypothetical protein